MSHNKHNNSVSNKQTKKEREKTQNDEANMFFKIIFDVTCHSHEPVAFVFEIDFQFVLSSCSFDLLPFSTFGTQIFHMAFLFLGFLDFLLLFPLFLVQ